MTQHNIWLAIDMKKQHKVGLIRPGSALPFDPLAVSYVSHMIDVFRANSQAASSLAARHSHCIIHIADATL